MCSESSSGCSLAHHSPWSTCVCVCAHIPHITPGCVCITRGQRGTVRQNFPALWGWEPPAPVACLGGWGVGWASACSQAHTHHRPTQLTEARGSSGVGGCTADLARVLLTPTFCRRCLPACTSRADGDTQAAPCGQTPCCGSGLGRKSGPSWVRTDLFCGFPQHRAAPSRDPERRCQMGRRGWADGEEAGRGRPDIW